MLKKYKISLAITTIVSILVVSYMYSHNYITFESGIHITFPQKPDGAYIEKEFQPANVESEHIDNNEISKVKQNIPSIEDNKIEEPRFFDDIIIAVKTFSPILAPMIPLYLNRKHKQKTKEATV